jgi:predicted Zn-dependent protease with MMP-like domain
MTADEADRLAGVVMDALDDEIAEALAGVVVYIVDGRGDPELKEAIRNAGLLRAEIPEDFRGMFLGTQAAEYGDDGGGGPAEGSIVLNAPNLATAAEVRDTLAHEIGHALGMNEEEVENLGLG